MCRLCDHLRRAQLQGREVLHAPAYSAQRRAHYLQEQGNRVAKALLVETEGSIAVALLPATAQLRDSFLSSSELGSGYSLAPASRVQQVFADCEVGTVPGFGSPFGLPVLMDSRLMEEPYLLVPGWTTCLSFKLTPREYEELESPRLMELSLRTQPVTLKG